MKTNDFINQQFQDFQDELLIREKKLKLPVSFNDNSLDDLLLLLDIPEKKLTK